eukprot:3105363-Ditylum_brightwellii.AAC.1
MNVRQTNATFAVHKHVSSKEHLKAYPDEPHGISYIQGIKISMEMHSFCEMPFGKGLIANYYCQTEQNTSVVGDFTESVVMDPLSLANNGQE